MARIASRITLDYRPSLQDCVNQDPQCKAKLDEATQLALNLYNPTSIGAQYSVYEKLMVFVTEHHFTAVEETLNDIVYGCCSDDNTMPTGSYVPRPYEAMILLAAARLRCIGLLWGLFEDERIHTENSEDWKASTPNWGEERDGKFIPEHAKLQELIRQFAKRSARYLKRDWRLFCSWTDTERRTLASVVEGYFPDTDVNSLPTDSVVAISGKSAVFFDLQQWRQ